MKLFCVVPATWVPGGGGAPPDGLPAFQSFFTACPGDATRALMVVDFGEHHGAEDAWRATPGMIVLPELWEWGSRLVPPAAVTLFGAWGVLATDTMGQAALKIRAVWPHFRH